MKVITSLLIFFFVLSCNSKNSKDDIVNLSSLQGSSTVNSSSVLPDWVAFGPVFERHDTNLFFKVFFDKQVSKEAGFKNAKEMAWKRIVFTVTDQIVKDAVVQGLTNSLSEYNFTELFFLSDDTNLRSISKKMKIIDRYWELKKDSNNSLSYEIYLRAFLSVDFLKKEIHKTLLLKLNKLRVTNRLVIGNVLTNISFFK